MKSIQIHSMNMYEHPDKSILKDTRQSYQESSRRNVVDTNPLINQKPVRTTSYSRINPLKRTSSIRRANASPERIPKENSSSKIITYL